MPDFKITLPDGASYKVTAPDEGTAYSALQTSLAGQPKAEAGRGGVLPSFAEGFATGFTDIPLGIAGLFTARPEETAAGKFSTGARDVIQDVLGIDPTKEATTAETGASALGSLGSFLVPGLGAVKVAKGIGMGIRGAGAAGSAASGLQGAALGAGEQAQRAMAQEQATGQRISDTSRQSAQLLGGAIGLTELLPLQRFLGPLEKILAKVPLSKAGAVSDLIQTGITRAAGSATAEGAQEAISQLAQNLVEKGLYNPELDVTEGLLGNAAAGGFAGGTVDAILQLMAGRKIRKQTTSRTELGKQLRAESDEAAPERVRAEALDGVNTLRAASPAGTISVVTSQMPGEEKPRYHIVDANKKSITSFSSADAAILAGKQYEVDSGGASKFEPPTITEMVKIKAPKGPKLSKAEKNKALQEAKRLKAQGALAPAPTVAPATTPEGQATTEASIEKVVAETPVIAPKKGRKKLAPTEAVVPPEAAPPVVTAAEITLPETPTEAPPAAELTPKAPAQPAPAKPPVTAKTYGEIAKEVPGAGLGFGDFAVDFNLRGTVPYARIRSLSRKTIYQKPGERVPESEAVDVWGVEDPNTVEPREGPKAGIGEMDQYVPEPFRKTIRDFLSGKIDNLEAERQLKATPVAPKPSKLSAAPTVATEAAAAPAVPADSDVPKGYQKVEKPRETALKVAFRPLESTPEGAAKAAEMDAKRDRVADALNKVLAPIVAKDVRLNLTSYVKEEGNFARGVVSPDGKIISLSLDIYDPALTEDQLIDKLMGEMNHEIIHTLTDTGLLNPAEIKTLFNAADKTKYQGKSFTYFDRAYATYAPIKTYQTQNEAGDTIPNMDMITEEAVAEMFRDYRAGKLKLNDKPKGIINKIIQFFKRMFRGFRDAEIGKVFTRIESGEVGARQGVATPAGGARKLSAAPQEKSAAFRRLASAQRDRPESAMLDAQMALSKYPSGPALGKALESVGDLSHRMAENPENNRDRGLEVVNVKVGVGLRLASNATDIERINAIPDLPELTAYADEHAKLPAYNDAQRAARDAAVALGRRDFAEAERNLLSLKSMIDNGTYADIAGSFDPQYEGAVTPAGAAPKLSVAPPVGSEEFAVFMGDSNRNNESMKNGVPVKFYHGTSKDVDFKSFKDSERGVWLETNEENAKKYSLQNDSMGFRREGWDMIPTNQKPRVIPLYARMENTLDLRGNGREEFAKANNIPFTENYARYEAAITRMAKYRGYDSIRWGDTVYSVFSPYQVKRQDNEFAPGATKSKKFSVAPAVGSDEFKYWWKSSKIVDDNGKPLVVYHGTKREFDEFVAKYGDGLIFFSTNPEFAGKWPVGTGGLREPGNDVVADIERAKAFEEALRNSDEVQKIFGEDYNVPDFVERYDAARALMGQRFKEKYAPYSSATEYEQNAGITVIPVFLSIQNPFDPRTDYPVVEAYLNSQPRSQGVVESGLHKSGNWVVYEDKGMIDFLKSKGYDGIWLAENVGGPHETIAAFNPKQVKSVFNQFEFGAAESKKFSVAPSAYENVPFLEKPAAVQKQILGDVERMRRKANDIAKDVARKSDTTLGNSANAANVEVRNAVRKLSAIPQPHPQSSFFEAANSTLFSTVAKPTSPGERIMDLLGGFGSSAGRVKFMDKFRHDYVYKPAQVEKYQRQLQMEGKIESDSEMYSAIASIDFADRSSHQIPTMIEFGAGEVETKNGDPNSMIFVIKDNNGDDTPAKFFKLVETGGPNGTSLSEQLKTLLVARAVVKRQKEGKDTPLEVTPEYIQKAEELALQYPVLEEAYGRFQRFNRKMIKAAVDSGRINQETFEAYTDDMNYYSLYREVGGDVLAPPPYGSIGKATKIKAFKGSEQGALIADPLVAMIRNMSFWAGATMRNIAAQKAHRIAMEAGIGRNLTWQGDKLGWQSPDPSRGEDERFMSYFVDGQEVRYAVTDPLFAAGLANAESTNLSFTMELLGLPTTALREMVTRDPGFMIANLLRDSISTWILAGSGANPLSTFLGMKKALMNDVSYQNLKRMAVVGSYDEAQKSPKQMVAGLRANIVGAQGFTNGMDVLKWSWDRLGKLSDASDAATRIAVYEAAIKDGADEYTAAYRALSIMNFSRRGASAGLATWTRLVPFLNARIQGFDVLYKGMKSAVQLASGAEQTAFEKQRGAAVWYRGLGLMAGALALAMLNEDDEDYKQIPQYIRDANFLIPIGGSKFVSIPKPFEAGLIFGTVPTTMYEMMRGTRSTRSGIKLFTSQLSSTFGFNPMPQVALPIFENLMNADFYTGQPLVSPGMQKLNPSLQYNASTSYVARGLGKLLAYSPFGYDYESGKFEGVSPIMIDNLITGYGGPIAGYVSMGIGGLTSAFGEDNQGIPVAGSNLPVIRRFFLDAQDKQPQAAAEAYELYQLVDKATRTASRLKKMGDVEALKEFREENVDILRIGKQVRKMAENLNNIRAQVRRLEVNTTMSGSEKKEKMRELRARELQVSRKVEEINLKLGR